VIIPYIKIRRVLYLLTNAQISSNLKKNLYNLKTKKMSEKLLNKIEFIVPYNYIHDSIIDDYVKKLKELNIHCNDDFTSENFKKATNKLIPGVIYEVNLISVPPKSKGQDCIDYLKKETDTLLFGGQGLSLVLNVVKEKLPKNTCIISFDEKDTLFKDSDGDHLVPFAEINSSGVENFICLDIFEKEFCDSYYLLYFKKVSKEIK